MATATATAGSPNPGDLPPQTLPRPPAVDPLEGHRLHLRALIRQERSAAYRRVDYLSHEWQMRLWREEAKGTLQVQGSSQSPSSVSSPTFPFGGGPDFNHGARHGGNGNRGSGRGHRDRANGRPGGLCVRWREKIVEWKYQLVDRFDLDREIVSISTFYLDRYLSMKYVDEELFQVVAVASLYLAAKIHSCRKFSIHSFAGIGLVRARRIEAMELSIMKALDWRLMPPTAAGFVENFYPLLAARCIVALGGGRASGLGLRAKLEESLEFCRFLSELSACAYPFVSAAPSSVALAAVLCGLERVGLLGGAWDAGGHCARLAEGLGLDVEGEEVRACGELLRKVHRLASRE